MNNSLITVASGKIRNKIGQLPYTVCNEVATNQLLIQKREVTCPQSLYNLRTKHASHAVYRRTCDQSRAIHGEGCDNLLAEAAWGEW